MADHDPAIHDRVAVLLFAWAAGGVDAIAYLTAHVFTANMTGNTVLLGISIGQGNALDIFHASAAMIGYITGVVMGTLITGEDDARAIAGVHQEVIIEAGILVLFAAVFLLPLSREGQVAKGLLILISALAMGMQSAAVKRLHLPGIATTYITGTITSLFSGLVPYWQGKKSKQATSNHPALRMSRSFILQAEVILSYLLAALVTGVLYKRWPAVVAWLPVTAIFAVAILLKIRHAQG